MDALVVDSISKEYPGVLALDKISFRVKEKSIHGFLGPNGAGKSTCMNIISGLIKQTDGKIKIFDQEVGTDNTSSLVGFLPENPPLYHNMTVKDYLNFVIDIFAKNKIDDSFKESIISKCGLENVLNRMIGNLSKGYKQRVGIAGAIIHNPQIVILDEPTVGLDPTAILEIRHLIKDLARDHTILFSSHQLAEVKALCNDITIINQGKIVASDDLSKVEAKFSSSNKIICLAENWNEKTSEDLLKSDLIETLSSEKVDENYKVEIYFDSKKSKKSQILNKIIENDIQVVEFFEEKLELEEIFSKAIE